MFDWFFTVCLAILAARILSWPFRIFFPVLGELSFLLFVLVALRQYSPAVALAVLFFLAMRTVSALTATFTRGLDPGAKTVLGLTVIVDSSIQAQFEIPVEVGRQACVTVPVSPAERKPLPPVSVRGPMRSWSLTSPGFQGREPTASGSLMRIPLEEVSNSVEHERLEMLLRVTLIPPADCKVEALIVHGG